MERLSDGEMRTDAEVARAWDANADQWIRHVRAGWDRYREEFNNPMFLAFLPELAGKAVIDLGCGEGRNTREFARRGARLTGVDVSRKMIEAASAAEAQEPLGITYRVMSFSNLSAFPAGGFDLAISTMALMDGPDFEGAARAARRVLAPAFASSRSTSRGRPRRLSPLVQASHGCAGTFRSSSISPPRKPKGSPP